MKNINWAQVWCISFLLSLIVIISQRELLQLENKELWFRMELQNVIEYRVELDEKIIDILTNRIHRLCLEK